MSNDFYTQRRFTIQTYGSPMRRFSRTCSGLSTTRDSQSYSGTLQLKTPAIFQHEPFVKPRFSVIEAANPFYCSILLIFLPSTCGASCALELDEIQTAGSVISLQVTIFIHWNVMKWIMIFFFCQHLLIQ